MYTMYAPDLSFVFTVAFNVAIIIIISEID